MTTAEIAKSYLARGWSIVPLVPRTKRPSRELAPYLRGEARMTPEECDVHWAANPEDGIAIITGLPSMLIVVDGDARHGADLAALRADCPSGYVVQTSDGFHCYCTHPGIVAIGKGKTERPGVDRQSDGGYVVAPPSVHPDTGWVYKVVADGELIAVPEWALRSPAPAVGESDAGGREPWVAELLANPSRCEPGTQHETLTRLAWWASGHLPEDIARGLLYGFAQALPLSRPHQPWTPGDINALLDGAYRKRAAKPVDVETQLPPEIAAAGAPSGGTNNSTTSARGSTPILEDRDNGYRFAMKYADIARYVHAWHRWHIFDGTRWQEDDVGAAMALAQRFVDELLIEALNSGDKAQLRAALRVRADHRMRSLLAQAQQPLLAARPAQFDCDPWLLNTLNGTLNLRTGELRPHDRNDYITRVTAAPYDPNAECPTFLRFLSDVFQGDEAMVDFVQRAVGYSLTGSTQERVLFVLHGEGRNGKSTLLEALSAALGDYATTTPTKTLLAKRGDDAIPNDIAKLKGMRFVTACETDEGKRLAEALVKQLTGGDTISARFMRAEWFTFKPEFKLWLATNHKPSVRSGGAAFWDRVKLLPFNVRFYEPADPDAPPNAPPIDKSLPERLQKELPGILRWAVTGCLEWVRLGLATPERVKSATAEYEHESDHVRTFIEECCTVGDALFVDNNTIYPIYTSWCASTREHAHPRVAFFKRLSLLGFVPAKEKGQRGWKGLTLRGPATQSPFKSPEGGQQ